MFVEKPHVKGQMFRGGLNSHMPNNPSARKRMRQEQKRRAHNRSIKSRVRTYITKARSTIATPAASSDEAAEAVRAAMSELDKAAKKGVLHKNNAARRKSRLMKQLNAAK
jgi:small subunit ribosomal protein S20